MTLWLHLEQIVQYLISQLSHTTLKYLGLFSINKLHYVEFKFDKQNPALMLGPCIPLFAPNSLYFSFNFKV